MLLCIDCGNTNTVFSVWDGERFLATWRIATNHQRTADEYFVWLSTLIGLQKLDLGMATSEGPSALVSMARTAKHPPPEVAAVPSRRTEASDIWALGHLLRRASFGEAPPDELPPNLAAIDKIFQRCLETNPRDRYASCDDIHRDLAACCLPEATEPRGFV